MQLKQNIKIYTMQRATTAFGNNGKWIKVGKQIYKSALIAHCVFTL